MAPTRPRILLADDNADMREYLGRLLSGRWEVEAVANGVAALEAARRTHPDVIVTDVMMPELDGFGLLQELRADPKLRSIPVMMLSARAGEEARIEGRRSRRRRLHREAVFGARADRARRCPDPAGPDADAGGSAAPPDGDGLPAGAGGDRDDARARSLSSIWRTPRISSWSRTATLSASRVREALPELADQGIVELLDTVYRTGQPFVGQAMPVMVQRRADQPPEECFFDFVYQPLLDSSGQA